MDVSILNSVKKSQIVRNNYHFSFYQIVYHTITTKFIGLTMNFES